MKKKSRKRTESRSLESLLAQAFHCHADQSWSCTGCGKCCTMWDIPVTREEKERIEGLDIPGFEFNDNAYFTPSGRQGRLFLIKRKHGKCIFLGDDGLCVIHRHHGERVKALACRLYPFHILKWDDGSASASLRFDCVAVSENHGKPLFGHLEQMEDFAAEMEGSVRRSRADYTLRVKPGTKALRKVADAYKAILCESSVSMPARLNYAARLLDFHGLPSNSQDVLSPNDEFKSDVLMYILGHSEGLEYTIDSAGEPERFVNTGFNYMLSGYARVDEGWLAGVFCGARLKRGWAIFKFMTGMGTLRPLGEGFPDAAGIVPLAAAQGLHAEKECEIMILRYLAAQLDALHFCGNPGINLTFEDGMRHLLLACPVIVSLAALHARSEGLGKIGTPSMAYSLRIVDHTFYHSPFFALRHVRGMTGWLTSAKIFPALLKKVFPASI